MTQFKSTAVLPYVKGAPEPLRRCPQRQGIRAVFKFDATLRSHLVRPKETVNPPRQESVVYRIPCECSKIYIGETGRPMPERMKEHERDTRLVRTQTCTVSEHANKTGHHPLWNKVKFIDRDSHWSTRGVKEAIHMILHPDNINRDKGTKFLKCGYQRSRNTAGDRYDSKPPREQLGVRPLGKPELTGTMGTEIRLSY